MINDGNVFNWPSFRLWHYVTFNQPTYNGLSFFSISLIISATLLTLSLLIYYFSLFRVISIRIPRKLSYQWKEMTYASLTSRSQESISNRSSKGSLEKEEDLTRTKFVIEPTKLNYFSKNQPNYSSTESVVADLRPWKSSFKPNLSKKFKLAKSSKMGQK